MKYNGVIHKKFALLDKNLVRLQNRFEKVDFDEFKSDWELRCACERVLQVMVEIVIDVAERIIALNNAGPVSTSGEAIEKLVELGVIKSAEPYKTMVKFRNIVVHQYEEVEPEILYNIAKNKLNDFKSFRDEIDNA